MKIILTFYCIILFSNVFAQNVSMPLYNGKIPNEIEKKNDEIIQKEDVTRIKFVQTPTIDVYLPSKRFATRQAVIICPGGGYWILAYDLEGTDIAKYLNSIGVAGIVLKYRTPTNGNCTTPHEVPLLDAKRAMRLVRFNATKWNIDASKIGIMGFSAGGHLASTLGTHFDFGNKNATDSIEQQSCKPDFMALIYPVITFTDSSLHKGSREALLGKNPDKELVKFYSNELQVNENTPPTFIVHANNDKSVPVENSVLMYEALHKKNIPAEIHILSEGGHGFGLGLNNEYVSPWSNYLRLWLKWLNSKK